MGEWKEMKFSAWVDINPPIALARSKEHFYIEMQDMDPSRRYVYPKRKRPLQGGSRFAEGDTLFARISPCTEKGNINQAAGLDGEPGYGSTEFLVFRAKPGLSHQDFILYFSKWNEIKDYAANNLQGTSGRQRVAKEAFDELEVVVPEVDEQRAIASVLSSLDAKIDLLHRQNKTLEAMAETLFRQWFVEKAEWEEKPLGSFGRIVCGKTPSKKVAEYHNGSIPFIRIPDMHGQVYLMRATDSITEKGKASQLNKTLPVGAVCVSCIATVGLVSITTRECQTNQQINSIIPGKEHYRYYLYLLMLSMYEELHAMASGGTATLNLNTSSFTKMLVPSPPEERLREFHGVVAPLFDKMLNNCEQLTTLTKLRDTLLPKLMSGEVRVEGVLKDLDALL